MIKLFCIASFALFSFAGFAAEPSLSTTPINGELADKEIANVVLKINEGEVTEGELATQRSTHPEVRSFAQELIRDHRANARKTRDLADKMDILPVTSDLSAWYQHHAEKVTEELNMEPIKDFDKAFLTKQISMHQTILDTINKRLLADAENGDLKKHLKETATSVAQHLEEAKNLKSKLY